MHSDPDAPFLTIIIGCTGSGKGAVAREVARRNGSEIISLDSMKIYRRMDIGTAKTSAEVRGEIPHHLIDIVEPSEEFSVADFVCHAEAAIDEIHRRDRRIMVVGGTPLYLKGLLEGLFEGPTANPGIRESLHVEAQSIGSSGLHTRLRGFDPVAAERIHPNDLRRIVRALEVFQLTGRPISRLQTQWDGAPRFAYQLIGLRRSREDQGHRINERVRTMIAAGLVDEVASLLAEEEPLSHTARQAVGYAEMIEHLGGRCTLDEAIEQIKINSRRLAKSQRTWFRRFLRAEWIDVEADAKVADLATQVLSRMEAAPS